MPLAASPSDAWNVASRYFLDNRGACVGLPLDAVESETQLERNMSTIGQLYLCRSAGITAGSIRSTGSWAGEPGGTSRAS